MNRKALERHAAWLVERELEEQIAELRRTFKRMTIEQRAAALDRVMSADDFVEVLGAQRH
jgi:hypothetical protein